MSNRSDLEQSRSELLAIFDEKLAKSPEWRAFRAIDRALAALGNSVPPTIDPPKVGPRVRAPRTDSYVELGMKAMEEAGFPQRTDEMLEFIGKNRQLSGELKKTRINVQSAFSKDPRFQSIVWRGGRAWWFADKPLPDDPAGGSLPYETHAAAN